MPTIMPNSVFFHIPKTGGTWVTEVLKDMGGHKDRYKSFGHPLNLQAEHTSPKYYKTKKFSFAFVRHPKSWYESIYRFRKGNDWPDKEKFPIDEKCKSDSFNGFVELMLKHYPEGFYTMVVKEFDGDEVGESLDFMGRQENLKEDLREALTLAGEKIKEKSFERGKANESKGTPVVWDKKLLNKVLKTERWVIEKYYDKINT